MLTVQWKFVWETCLVVSADDSAPHQGMFRCQQDSPEDQPLVSQ